MEGLWLKGPQTVCSQCTENISMVTTTHRRYLGENATNTTNTPNKQHCLRGSVLLIPIYCTFTLFLTASNHYYSEGHKDESICFWLSNVTVTSHQSHAADCLPWCAGTQLEVGVQRLRSMGLAPIQQLIRNIPPEGVLLYWITVWLGYGHRCWGYRSVLIFGTTTRP